MATRNTAREHGAPSARSRFIPIIPALVLLAACSLDDSKPLDEGEGGSGLLGRGGRGGVVTSGAGGLSSGGSAGAGDTAGVGGGGNAGAGAGGGGAGGITADAGPGVNLGPWNFNSLAEAQQWPPSGLEIPPDAAVSWTSAGADEPLGSMVLSASTTAVFQVAVLPDQADQAHRKVFFRARSAAEGKTETLKPFVMSTGWKWSDGGEFMLTSQWSTAMLDLDSPSYEGADYNASSLINVGVVLLCASTEAEPAPCSVWIDRAWLE